MALAARGPAYEGCEGLGRGAVVAGLSAKEQACFRSVVVDGSGLGDASIGEDVVAAVCALRQRRRQLDPRALSLLRSTRRRAKQHAGPFHAAAQSGAVWKHLSFAARALLPALKIRPPGTPCPAKRDGQGDRSLFTGVVHGDGSASEGQDADLCVASWGLVANTGTGQPVTVSFFIQDVDGAELFGLFMFSRIARAPAQYVTDSRFVEQSVTLLAKITT